MEGEAFQALFRRARGGDEAAQEAVFSLALRLGLKAARRRIRPEDRALMESQDLRQDVLLRLHRRLPDLSFAGERDLAGWIAEATRRVLKERRRDAHRAKRDVARTVPFPSDGVTDPGTRSVRKALLRIAVEEKLGVLPPATAELIRLRALEERSFAEVATVMGLPSADAARKRFARAMAHLSTQLGTVLDG